MTVPPDLSRVWLCENGVFEGGGDQPPSAKGFGCIKFVESMTYCSFQQKCDLLETKGDRPQCLVLVISPQFKGDRFW